MKNRLLINSLPKSGTHLLAKVAELCDYQEHFTEPEVSQKKYNIPLFFNYREVKNVLNEAGKYASFSSEAILVGSLTPIAVDSQTFKTYLSPLQNHRYILGHIAWNASLSKILTTLNYHHLFIIRDPRAVIASLLNFISNTVNMPKPHFLQADFERLSSLQQLDLILEGGYAPLAEVKITPFSEIYFNMLSWQNDPHSLVVRFEALIGEQGGGSSVLQHETVKKIVNYLGYDFDTKMSDQVETIYNPKARTFRKGSINSWKSALDSKILQRIEDYCAPICQVAGYQ